MRPRGASRPGTDRWLVSYADFMTLLLAFFVAMYAVSDVNEAKLASAAASFGAAFTASPATPAPTPAAPVPAVDALEPPTPAGPITLGEVRARIAVALAGAITDGRLELGTDERGLVLSLPESATFAVASADVTPAAQAVIDRVAATLAPLDNAIRVEGHTDDVPIRTPRFQSNWELSTARASAVVARFIDRRVEPRRLSAAGYGEFHPRVANDSAAGRASNRRVDVVVIGPGGGAGDTEPAGD